MADAVAARPPGGRPEPIALAILTGFLGAGKTALLNRLLLDPALADTVVVINEIGEVGLDHLLVQTVDDDLVLLAAGCLCCTVRGDLVSSLEDLLRRRDNGRIPPFRRVVIETTGLADPAPVIGAVLHHPYLSLRFALSGILTVVDASVGAETLDRHEEARRQAAVAERIVLTKADAAEASEVEALVVRLRRLNPGADIRVLRPDDRVGAALLPEAPFDLAGRSGDVAAWLTADAIAAAEGGRHDDRIRSFVLTAERPLGRGALDAFLDVLRSIYGPGLLRLKGIVDLLDSPGRPLLIQGVRHILHVPTVLPNWPDPDHRTRIVVIGEDVSKVAVQRLWDAFAGRPGVDAPDAAAIVDNPLAPPTLAR